MCTSLVSLFWLKVIKCTYDVSFGELCTLKNLVLKTKLDLELFLVQISFTFDGGAPHVVEGVCSICVVKVEKQRHFTLKVILMWTIHDYSTYAPMAGGVRHLVTCLVKLVG